MNLVDAVSLCGIACLLGNLLHWLRYGRGSQPIAWRRWQTAMVMLAGITAGGALCAAQAGWLPHLVFEYAMPIFVAIYSILSIHNRHPWRTASSKTSAA